MSSSFFEQVSVINIYAVICSCTNRAFSPLSTAPPQQFSGQIGIVRRDGGLTSASIVHARSGRPVERRSAPAKRNDLSFTDMSGFYSEGGADTAWAANDVSGVVDEIREGPGDAGGSGGFNGGGHLDRDGDRGGQSRGPFDAATRHNAGGALASAGARVLGGAAHAASSAASAPKAPPRLPPSTSTMDFVSRDTVSAPAPAAGMPLAPAAAGSRVGVGALRDLFGPPPQRRKELQQPPQPRTVVPIGAYSTPAEPVPQGGAYSLPPIAAGSRPAGISRSSARSVSPIQMSPGDATPGIVYENEVSGIQTAPTDGDMPVRNRGADDTRGLSSHAVAAESPGSSVSVRALHSGGTWAGAAPTRAEAQLNSGGTWRSKPSTAGAFPTFYSAPGSASSDYDTGVAVSAPAGGSRAKSVPGPRPSKDRQNRDFASFDEPPVLPADDTDEQGLNDLSMEEAFFDGGLGAEPVETAPQQHHKGLSRKQKSGDNDESNRFFAGAESLAGEGSSAAAGRRGNALRDVPSGSGSLRINAPSSARSRALSNPPGSPTSLSAYAYPSAAVVASIRGAETAALGRSIGAGRLAASLTIKGGASATLPRPGAVAATAFAIIADDQEHRLHHPSSNFKNHQGRKPALPIHPVTHIGGNVARTPRDNEVLIQSDADMLAFSRRPRRVSYQPGGARALRNDPMLVALPPAQSLSSLGPASETAERAARRTVAERAKSYSEPIAAAARVAAERSNAQNAMGASALTDSFPPPPIPPLAVGMRKGPAAEAALAAVAVRERTLDYARKVRENRMRAAEEGGGAAEGSPGSYAARGGKASPGEAKSAGATVRRPSPLRVSVPAGGTAAAGKAFGRSVQAKNDTAAVASASTLIEMEEEHERRRAEAEAIRRDFI